jgi:hypothetical protein
MPLFDVEIGGTPAHSHYSTDALLPNEYIWLFADDFARGDQPHRRDAWVLVTGCLVRADDPAQGWVVYTFLSDGSEFLHYRHNPTVIRAIDGAVPREFDASNLSARVAAEGARLKTAQAKLDRLSSLAYYVEALDTARRAADARRGQPRTLGV